MRMTKKLLYVLLVGVVTASLCMGCGSDKADITETGNTEQQSIEDATVSMEFELAESTEAEPTETPEVEEIESTETEEAASAETEQEETLELTEESASEPEPQTIYTYTDVSATMYAQQTVNVRNQPSTDGEKVGSLSTNDEITVTGQCNETKWYRFEYNGAVAYVSNKYIGENKVEAQQAPADNGSGQASSTVTTECPYPMLQVIDEGGDKVYYYYTPSTQNRNIYNECASIIASRHGWYTDFVNGGTAGSGGAGEPEKTNYTYNGEVVYRARPCTYLIGPNGGGPANALEVVICP